MSSFAVVMWSGGPQVMERDTARRHQAAGNEPVSWHATREDAVRAALILFFRQHFEVIVLSCHRNEVRAGTYNDRRPHTRLPEAVFFYPDKARAMREQGRAVWEPVAREVIANSEWTDQADEIVNLWSSRVDRGEVWS